MQPLGLLFQLLEPTLSVYIDRVLCDLALQPVYISRIPRGSGRGSAEGTK